MATTYGKLKELEQCVLNLIYETFPAEPGTEAYSKRAILMSKVIKDFDRKGEEIRVFHEQTITAEALKLVESLKKRL